MFDSCIVLEGETSVISAVSIIAASLQLVSLSRGVASRFQITDPAHQQCSSSSATDTVDLEIMYIGNTDPPCFKIPACKFLCNDNKCCKKLGSYGWAYFDEHRAIIMAILGFFTVLSLILSIVPIASASFDEDNVENTSWTYGKSSNSNFEIWIGLKIIVLKIGGVTESAGWNSADCQQLSSSNFCDDCKSSCLGSVSMVVMNFITMLPNLKGCIARSTRKGDSYCEKNFTVITGLISTITTLSAISVYVQGCQNSLPTSIGGLDIDYSTGPGLACLATATFFQPIIVIGNLLTPVVEDNDEGKGKDDSYQYMEDGGVH